MAGTQTSTTVSVQVQGGMRIGVFTLSFIGATGGQMHSISAGGNGEYEPASAGLSAGAPANEHLEQGELVHLFLIRQADVVSVETIYSVNVDGYCANVPHQAPATALPE